MEAWEGFRSAGWEQALGHALCPRVGAIEAIGAFERRREGRGILLRIKLRRTGQRPYESWSTLGMRGHNRRPRGRMKHRGDDWKAVQKEEVKRKNG